MHLDELPDEVIQMVERRLEQVCILVDLPLAAADALIDALDALLDEVHG